MTVDADYRQASQDNIETANRLYAEARLGQGQPAEAAKLFSEAAESAGGDVEKLGLLWRARQGKAAEEK